MGTHLDLDDLVADQPEAKKELDGLRAEVERLRAKAALADEYAEELQRAIDCDLATSNAERDWLTRYAALDQREGGSGG